eukprot:2477856-Prymnesium_polylepis.1
MHCATRRSLHCSRGARCVARTGWLAAAWPTRQLWYPSTGTEKRGGPQTRDFRRLKSRVVGAPETRRNFSSARCVCSNRRNSMRQRARRR